LWIFDSNLGDELERRSQDYSNMKILLGFAKNAIDRVTTCCGDLRLFTEDVLGEELADAIDEFTNDRLDVLIVLLILVENIAYVESIYIPEESEKSVLRALKNQLESRYELQLDLDIESIAA
jgi:hypothetical protein